MTPAQPVNYSDAADYWDDADAGWRPWEAVLREHWEADERDAMFTAEMSGGPSLMERAAGPLLFLIVAGVVACAVLTVARGAGWI